jgi:hypothetical protein
MMDIVERLRNREAEWNSIVWRSRKGWDARHQQYADLYKDAADEIERLRDSARQAYEELLGDTDSRAWHSDRCYRTVAHRSAGCTCGLDKAVRLLRNMWEKK